MNNDDFIFLSVTVTVILGCSASLTLGNNALRTAEVKQSLGQAEGTQGERVVSRFLTLFRDLPFSRTLRRHLVSAGLSWDAAVTELSVTATMVIVFVGARPLVGRIAGGALATCVPFLFFRWLQRRTAQRTEQFVSQLPEVSRVLSNGTSAGMSVERALDLAAKEVPEPAGVEMQRVVSQLAVGWSLDAALADLSERIPSRELNILIRTIVIQSRSGGALVTALQDIARSLEDRKQLHREVRTAILGSAVSGYIVPVMGISCIVLLNLMKPGVLDDMATSFIGRLILIASFVFFGLGALLMKVVSRVEV